MRVVAFWRTSIGRDNPFMFVAIPAIGFEHNFLVGECLLHGSLEIGDGVALPVGALEKDFGRIISGAAIWGYGAAVGEQIKEDAAGMSARARVWLF